MEVLTYISCMDTAYVRANPPPKQPYKVEETLHFRYLKLLVICCWVWGMPARLMLLYDAELQVWKVNRALKRVDRFLSQFIPHTIHVWYIYLHLVVLYGKCR